MGRKCERKMSSSACKLSVWKLRNWTVFSSFFSTLFSSQLDFKWIFHPQQTTNRETLIRGSHKAASFWALLTLYKFRNHHKPNLICFMASGWSSRVCPPFAAAVDTYSHEQWTDRQICMFFHSKFNCKPSRLPLFTLVLCLVSEPEMIEMTTTESRFNVGCLGGSADLIDGMMMGK